MIVSAPSNLRAVFISPEVPPGAGGIGTQTYQIARGLNELGLETMVICPLDYVSKEEADNFDGNQSFPILRLAKTPWLWPQVPLRALQIFQAIRKNKPQYILSSSWRSGLYAVLPQYILGIPRVSIGHGTEFQFRSGLQRVLTRWVFNSSVRCIAVSEYTKGLMEKLGISREKISIIPNGADPDRFHPGGNVKKLKKELGLEEKKILLTVGRMCDRKGQDTVIRAIPEIVKVIPDIAYLMVGHPQDKKNLEELADSLGVRDCIRFFANVLYEDLPQYYGMADVYILNSRVSPSGDNEGFGISIIEAALTGVPAIGSLGCGIEEAIEVGITGMLVPPDSPGDTAKAVVSLFES